MKLVRRVTAVNSVSFLSSGAKCNIYYSGPNPVVCRVSTSALSQPLRKRVSWTVVILQCMGSCIHVYTCTCYSNVWEAVYMWHSPTLESWPQLNFMSFNLIFSRQLRVCMFVCVRSSAIVYEKLHMYA